MIEIIKGATQKPKSSQALVDCLSSVENFNGVLYVGYPIFSTPEGRYPIDAILISETKGIVILNVVEGNVLPSDYQGIQDDSYNKLEAKFRNYKALMKGRKLDVPISVLTFAPNLADYPDFDEDYPLSSSVDLEGVIIDLPDENFQLYKPVLSVIQSISTIRKGLKKRAISNPDSKGAKLQKLEEAIANLDNQQGKAVIETVDTVQRIRGLAGSGKTIVLALKAAYLHSQHPDWKIAVTFHTRSLKGQFKRLINTFTIEQTGEEPNWENLKIIHAWGSGSGEKEGIYYNFCKENSVEYLDFGQAKNKYGRGNEFKGVCRNAVSTAKYISPTYEAILVDEAQDFPPEFLNLCFGILGSKKRLVYAYDELQSLNSQSLPSPEEIFGNNEKGEPLVVLSEESQDIILEKCYRNSKPVLTTAHALGFGIYRDEDPKTGTGLIQMFDNSQLWADVGYSVRSGSLEDGKDVVLERTSASSPEFLHKEIAIDDLIHFQSFQSEQEQAQWIVNEIKQNIQNDELRPDDIIVINPDPLSTKNAAGIVRAELFKEGINSHLAGVDTSPDVFFDSDAESIAFTGIYRAKGNEAGMVYVINGQDCFDSFGKLSTVRNQLFTAITRSKAWVRVLGVGPNMDKLVEEYMREKDSKYTLQFKYPTAELREKLNIVNRDMSEAEKQKVQNADYSLNTLLSSLNNGEVQVEDLDSEQLSKLQELLAAIE